MITAVVVGLAWGKAMNHKILNAPAPSMRADSKISTGIRHILQYRVPIGNADSLPPMEVLPFVILLEEPKKWDNLNAKLRAEIKSPAGQVPLRKHREN
jgi:hypothetical protein